jgi:hypothetical protein
MKKSEVIEYFGSAARTARAMRISRAAVTMWPDELGDNVSFKVELVTGGNLKSDETLRLESDRSRHVRQ